MFQKTKNIDTAFRQIRLFTLLCLLCSAVVSVFSIHEGMKQAERERQKIYVLSSGKVLEAIASERRDNIPVEARDHVKMFHYDFFTLDPDEKVIESNIGKALYLAD